MPNRYFSPMDRKKPASDKERRDARLRAALRENLKRRKAQARGRAQAGQGSATVNTPDDEPDGADGR